MHPSSQLNDTALMLAQQLIQQASVTPDKSSCHRIIGTFLEKLGFQSENLSFAGINNLWAYLPSEQMPGEQEELFVFCGHTDVVSPGDEKEWRYPPFSATLAAGNLYGRGSADMKSSIAAMLAALALLKGQPRRRGIGVLITADEEGPARDGVNKALAELNDRGVRIDFCLVGEPTSKKMCGDTIKNGRRGSLSLTATATGVQGHTAYIKSADNVLHRMVDGAQALLATDWDALAATEKQEQKTALNITSIKGSSAAGNMTAPRVEMSCNWRYANHISSARIKEKTQEILPAAELLWHESALPYHSPLGNLAATVRKAIKEEQGTEAQCSSTGGTSDGRFFAPYGTEVVEFGPLSKTIHRIDECVSLDELHALTAIYARFCRLFLL